MEERFLVVFGHAVDKNGVTLKNLKPIVILSENITWKEKALVSTSKRMIENNGGEWF